MIKYPCLARLSAEENKKANTSVVTGGLTEEEKDLTRRQE